MHQFRTLEKYVSESHFSRKLVECIVCGHRYYSEFTEEIDWANGEDPQYYTYIPIIPDKYTIDALNDLNPFELMTVKPRLQMDWPSDLPEPKIQWIR